MLVLSRKPGESLILTDVSTGQRIELVVTQIRPGTVRIGVTAPPEWEIVRAEIADQIDDELRAKLREARIARLTAVA